MRRLLAILILLVFSRPLIAQQTAPAALLAPGARVRITLLGAEPRVGVVVGHLPDTLLVRFPEFSNGDHVPLDAISQIEVSTGGQRNLLKGAMVGMLVGAGVGAILGSRSNPDSFTGKGAATADASVACAAMGLLVGTFAALWRGEDWREVSAKARRIEAGFVPGRGATLTMSLRY
jgi:hypothetical protein